jgi:SNF2 family DNA or RNA helicase
MQDKALVERFHRHEKMPPKQAPTSTEALVKLMEEDKGLPDFKNGRKLRDYQETSFKWMVQNNLTGNNCILGDEMGLGKTAQVCT